MHGSDLKTPIVFGNWNNGRNHFTQVLVGVATEWSTPGTNIFNIAKPFKVELRLKSHHTSD